MFFFYIPGGRNMRRTIVCSLRLENGDFVAITSEGPSSCISDKIIDLVKEIANQFPVDPSSRDETLTFLNNLNQPTQKLP
jgi:hypothetical protein